MPKANAGEAYCARRIVVALFIVAAALGVATPARADDECLLEVQDGQGNVVADNGQVCGEASNKSCTYSLKLCVNQASASCTAAALKKKIIKATGHCGGVGKLKVKPSGSTALCGNVVTLKLKTKKKGTKEATCLLKAVAKAKGRKDIDRFTLDCKPQAGQCPTTTTTTASTTTTTIARICGNGTLEPGEACDTPGQQGTCGAGQLCNCSCTQCVTPVACTCGTGTPTQLNFTTGFAAGGGGTVTPGSCIAQTTPPAGNACGTDADCTPGTCRGALASGGLYFGGGGVAVPLPSTVPDMGLSVTKVAFCTGDGSTMEICASTPTDIGGAHPTRTCTAGGVDDPEYPACVGGDKAGKPCRDDGECTGGGTCTGTMTGCLFGPPLPVPNVDNPSTSTCVINRVSRSASGSTTCSGTSAIDIPLASDIYLDNDLLGGQGPGRPDVPGIQPCPLCTKVCSGGTKDGLPCQSDPDCTGGGTCSAGTSCIGGPNHGNACTPADSDVPTICTGVDKGKPCTTDSDCTAPGLCNHPYPTSHDCPPPSTSFLGTLPISFGLTTGTSSKTSTNIGSDPTQTRVFCGFCAKITPITVFNNPPIACTADSDCAAFAPFSFCAQRTSGAFGNRAATTVSETGAASSGSLSDRQLHNATLVSVFCIPPLYDPIVDVAADLPGPGAVALPGQVQLLP